MQTGGGGVPDSNLRGLLEDLDDTLKQAQIEVDIDIDLRLMSDGDRGTPPPRGLAARLTAEEAAQENAQLREELQGLQAALAAHADELRARATANDSLRALLREQEAQLHGALREVRAAREEAHRARDSAEALETGPGPAGEAEADFLKQENERLKELTDQQEADLHSLLPVMDENQSLKRMVQELGLELQALEDAAPPPGPAVDEESRQRLSRLSAQLTDLGNEGQQLKEELEAAKA